MVSKESGGIGGLNLPGLTRRQILTNAAVAISDAAKRLDTSQEFAPALSPRSSGRSDGSTTVRPAANMDGAEVSLAGT